MSKKIKNGLFELPTAISPDKYLSASPLPDLKANKSGLTGSITPEIDDRVLDVFNRAENIRNPQELIDLWIGRLENEEPGQNPHSDRARKWCQSKVRSNYSAEDVLNSRSTVTFVKELFNAYFRDDVYGNLFDEGNHILSSGSIFEAQWGLPDTLKDCIMFALDQDWYGYSDSRGRESSLGAISRLENAKLGFEAYTASNVAINMGATQGISSLADFIKQQFPDSQTKAICGIPNYPPLVQSIANRFDMQLVPLGSGEGKISLTPVEEAIDSQTRLIMIQTVANPTGSIVDEDSLASLIRSIPPSTYIILDECHEWLGPPIDFCEERSAKNVIRVNSMSKTHSAPGIKAGWFIAASEFIAEYYEYASTHYGGPPSLFYTLLEFMASFECWRLQGEGSLTSHHLQEFESTYGLTLSKLNKAFEDYCMERSMREKDLYYLRAYAHQALCHPNTLALNPDYSINLAVKLLKDNDSYASFRKILKATGVSVYPGILNFYFSESIVRISPMIEFDILKESLKRLRRFFDSY